MKRESNIFFLPRLDRPPGDELMIREVLDGKGEIPLILIVGVSVCGTVLLLLNIVLISCFVHKKKKKEEAEHGRKMAGGGGAGSDGKASRTAGDGNPGEGALLTSIGCGFRLTLSYSCILLFLSLSITQAFPILNFQSNLLS